MNSELKTALIFGVVIIAGIGIMSIVFSSFDEGVNSSNMPAKGNFLAKIDKSGFKVVPNLVGIAHYLNTTPEKLSEEMEGKWYSMTYGHTVALIVSEHFHTLLHGVTSIPIKDY